MMNLEQEKQWWRYQPPALLIPRIDYACGMFCKLLCVSFGFGTRTDYFASPVLIASTYIHLVVNGFVQTIALEHPQLTDLLNVRGAVRGG